MPPEPAGAASPAAPPDVDALIEAVRAAGDGAPDPKGARAARQARAGEADVVRAAAHFRAGSPEGQRFRSGLRALGVTSKAIEAGVSWYRAQERKARKVAMGAGPRDDQDDRPAVRIGPALHVNVAEAVVALRDDPDLYARDGALVRITREPGASPVIRPHTAATLRVRLARFARFEKWEGSDDGAWVACLPPDAVTKGVLDAAEWEGIRVLVGIIETPSLRPDGSVIQDPGFDEATGYLYLPTTTFDEVPEAPTQQQAMDALQWAWVELCYDFPFRGMGYPDPAALTTDPSGVHRFLTARSCPDAWGVLSGAMTITARPAIDGDTPAHLYDASTPGSGKGLQVDLVCLSTTGRIPSKLTWPTGESKGERDAEVGKMIGGEVLSGSPIVIFDEILTPFGGPAINNVLTCGGRTKIRILGETATPERQYVAVMLGAGNNINCRDNTHRRVLIPRLESPEENPENHTGWRKPEPLRTWTKDHRAQIVVALLTVLRAYIVAGKPDVYERNGVLVSMPPIWGGGFEEWSKLVPRAILFAGGGDVMGCRPTSDPDARNEERDAIATVLDAVSRLEPKVEGGTMPTGAGITVKTVLEVLFTKERMRGDALPPDGYDDAREAIEGLTGTAPGRRPQSKRLGDKLHTWKRRPIEGRMLEMAKKDRTNARKWTVRTLGAPGG